MKLNRLIFLSIFVLAILAPVVLAEPLDTIRSAIDTAINFFQNNKEISSFILFFIIFVSALWFGGKKVAENLKWDEKSNALKALVIAMAVAFTVGSHYFQSSRNYWLIYELGGVFLLIATALIVLLFAFIFYKKSGKSLAGLMPLLISLVVVLLYNAINWLSPNFSDKLGDWGGFIDAIYWIASAALVIMVIAYILKLIGGGISKVDKAIPEGKGWFEKAGDAIKNKLDARKKAKEEAEAVAAGKPTKLKDVAAKQVAAKSGQKKPWTKPTIKTINLPKQKAEKEVKEKVEQQVEEVEDDLYSALRRVYRFNKKVLKNIEAAHNESLKKPIDKKKLKKKLEKAKRYEDKEIDFEALANDYVGQLMKFAKGKPGLKDKLNIFNKSLQLNLSKIKNQIERALVNSEIPQRIGTVPVILASAKSSSEKIAKEVPALEAVAQSLEKEVHLLTKKKK